MDTQQIIALVLVGIAAVYLGRNAVRAIRSLFSEKGGCASGCGKCAFAGKDGFDGKPAPSSARPNIIPLSDIRSLPRKREE